MTTVTVQSGACGYSVRIRARKGEGGRIMVDLDTECAMVKAMLEDIAVLERFATLGGYGNNPVHQSAKKHLKHAACAVPSAVLKAVEVEAGLNVAKDVSIVFVKEE